MASSRRLIISCVIGSVSLVALSVPSFALTRPSVYPTQAQIANFLAVGTTLTSVPSGDILPGIGVPGTVDFMQPHPNWSDCSVTGPDIAITPEIISQCTFGDRAAKVTVGLYGDSNAAMWAPAFDVYGATHHQRVIVLAHMGCTTWPRPWAPVKPTVNDAISERECATWRVNVLSAFRRAKVSYVVPVSIDTSRVRDFVRPSKLANSLTVGLLQIRHYGMRPILLEPVPRYTFKTDYLNCLTAHRSDISQCMLTTGDVKTNRLNQTFSSAARMQSVPVISTTDLFCSPRRCPLFVSWEGRTIQLYRDGQHITAAYAQLISAALAPRLLTAISHAH